MKRMNGWIAVVALAGLIGACGGGGSSDSTGPNPPSGPTVTASAARVFTPATLTVSAGATVTWVFESVAHTVVFAAVAGAPANIDQTSNANVSRTFSTAGTFTYVCTIHPGMAGTIIVH